MNRIEDNILDSKRIECFVLKKETGLLKEIEPLLRPVEAVLGDFRYFVDLECGNFDLCGESSYAEECPCNLGYRELKEMYFSDYEMGKTRLLWDGYFEYLERKIR
jgi:hypothetical protein